MNFPNNNFVKISLRDIKPIIYERYGDLCKCYPMISDNRGERWIVKFKKGFKLDNHTHSGKYEFYMLSGKMRYVNGNTNEECILEKGDYYCNPPNIPHSEECLEDAEMFWMYPQKSDL